MGPMVVEMKQILWWHKHKKSILTVWDGMASLSVCILPADRTCYVAYMCKYIYARTGHSNTNYNMKYNFFGRHSLLIGKSKLWLNHRTINNYHLFSRAKCHMQCRGIFQRYQTKVDMSLPECTIWYTQWHLVDA